MNPPIKAKDLLTNAFYKAVAVAHPSNVLEQYLPTLPSSRLIVIGAGKAASAMVQAVEAFYPHERLEGLVITRYEHSLPTQVVEVVEASHPVPDAAGLKATKRVLALLEDVTEEDTVLCLISGGGSALLTAPLGITLEQQVALTKALLYSGASINEMNAVRKHLSSVKGGWLAKAAMPAQVHSFYLSDVVGDDLSTIASGPTCADETTFKDALEILDYYGLTGEEVGEARAHLLAGANGDLPETPKANDPCFKNVKNTIIASNQLSLEAVSNYFKSQGIQPYILSSSIEGEAREAAKVHAAIARQIHDFDQPVAKPCILISGGETTVTVRQQKTEESGKTRKRGRGGRNSEFALSLALELEGLETIYALVADSDGIDGSEDNAGVFVLPNSVKTVGKREAKQYLAANDSYSFFEAADGIFVSGPTNTNVNDLRFILIL